MGSPYTSRQTPLHKLLQHAEDMIAHNELDAAEALLKVIIIRNPQHTAALTLLDSIKPQPDPTPVKTSRFYVDYDYHTGMFEVLDKNDERVEVFLTHTEAEDFVRRQG